MVPAERGSIREIRDHLGPDSPDGLAFGQPRAPTSAGGPRPYARSGGRVLTDATGENGNPRFRQRFRGLRARRPNPNGESGYKRAIDIDEKVYGPDHPEVATDLANL